MLVGQHRYTLDAYSWEIPEGGVPPGEPAVAHREDAVGGGHRTVDGHGDRNAIAVVDDRREVGLITKDLRTVRRMAVLFEDDWKKK